MIFLKNNTMKINVLLPIALCIFQFAFTQEAMILPEERTCEFDIPQTQSSSTSLHASDAMVQTKALVYTGETESVDPTNTNVTSFPYPDGIYSNQNGGVAAPSQRYAENVNLIAIQNERNENLNRATTFVVTKVEDTDDSEYDPDTGNLIAHGCDSDDCSLREAVIASSNTPGLDTITFSPLFDTPQTIVLTLGQIEFGGFGGTGGNHIVIGPGEDLLTIDAQGNSRIFYMGFAHMLLELSNMTLANGNSATSSPYGAWGGAILNLGRNGNDYDIKMTNVTIKNCVSNKGAGLSALRSQWLFENVTFDGNQGNVWGAAFESEGGITVMNNCAVINSTTRDAMKVFASNFVSLDASLTMNNCTMSGNDSSTGTSVVLATGQGTNTAFATLNNCTVTDNNSTNAAIVFDGLAVIDAQNSIISGNTGGASPDINGGSLESTSSYNLIGTGGGLTDGVDGNIIGINDPGLDALTDNGGTTLHHHPISNSSSPAYNAGSSTETTDQLGNPRGVYGADDIGAIELQLIIDLSIDLKVFLQGPTIAPFTGEENLMRDDLRVANLIPLATPYSDGKTINASILNTAGANAVVDWVWVELRDATDNTKVIEGQSALLLRNGNVVDTDGTSALSFEQDEDSYHIAIKHRNHLGIMSAATISLNANTAAQVDFTDDSVATFGTNAQTTYEMPTGIQGMWAGDANDDAEIIFLNTGAESVEIKQLVLDRSAAESPFGASVFYKPVGYYAEDINMDGEVIFLNAGNELLYIKDNVLAHPENQLFNSVFYTINSQLP